MIIRRLALEMKDYLLGTASKRRFSAERMGPQPIDGFRPEGKDLFANSTVNDRIIVGKQTQKGRSLAWREPFRFCDETSRFHNTCR